MWRFIKNYKNASGETKLFIWTVVSIGLILVVTTFYAYSRLDSHRSYQTEINESTTRP